MAGGGYTSEEEDRLMEVLKKITDILLRMEKLLFIIRSKGI